jgi:rhodanese-related sulfurtransferase
MIVAALMSLVLLTSITFAQNSAASEKLQAKLTALKTQVGKVTAEELNLMLTDGVPFTLIDVRNEPEWAAGHLPTAKFFTRGKLEFYVNDEEFPKLDEEIVVYCKTQGRSLLAAGTLLELGFTKVKYLEGGFMAWVNSGLPLVTPLGKVSVIEFEPED